MANLCGDCGVKPRMKHAERCDVARCLATGQQRLQCGGEEHKYHGQWYGEHVGTCGNDIWRGEWPGIIECRELGLYAKWNDLNASGWVKCDKDDPEAHEDLNELARMAARGEIIWNRERARYVLPEATVGR